MINDSDLTHDHRVPGRPPSGWTDHSPLVRCVDVGKTFGEGQRAVVAVHNATFSVRPYDRIALVGPSGSGKSTLLHLVGGLETPTVGRVTRRPAPAAADDHTIGIVFQTPSLIASLTALENVTLPLHFGEDDDAEDRALAALAALGLSDLGASLPQELSGGQAQRVVIARVLAMRPRLILADEPTSQLDRTTADRVIDLLISVADDIGAALMVATHDMTIAHRLRTRWTMHDGQLLLGTAQSGDAA